jgi:glyceraldehyde-3-phosphate dehydrogenase (ferredoxin)
MGLDSIQTGGTAAWIMELVHSNLIPPADFGLPPADEMRFEFASHPETFDLEMDSRRNADYAYQVVYMLLFDERGAPFRQGIRAAAQILDVRYGLTEPGRRTIDRAVFTAHGEHGCMVPNQYWVPGMLSPMPMMGKYFVYYGVDFLPPRELGRKCVERMVYELFSENSGVCRFHRKWAEAIVDEIISCHYDFEVDYKTHQFELVRQIYERDAASVAPWEGERTIDVIWQYLEKWDRFGLDDHDLHGWLARFRAPAGKWAAARAYWEEMQAGIAEAFQAGPEAIPEIVSPYQAAKMDVMEKR